MQGKGRKTGTAWEKKEEREGMKGEMRQIVECYKNKKVLVLIDIMIINI